MNEYLHTPLSERELEILRLVAQGKSNKEIASELFISINTVKVHLAKIFQRIGVASRTEATLYAIEHEHVENPNHTLVSPQEQQGEARVELVVPETVTVERAVVKLKPGQVIRKFWWAFWLGLMVLASFTVAWDRGWIFPQPTPDPILAAMNEDRWKELAPMSVARANMAVTVYNNKIYVIGGETEEGVTGLTEVYDIATDTWARLPDKPTPVTNAKAVAVGGKIYVPGGRLAPHSNQNSFESYDILSKEWEQLKQIPVRFSEYELTLLDGNLILIGNDNPPNSLLVFYSYDPKTDSWEYLNEWAANGQLLASTLINRKIFLVIDLEAQDRDQEISLDLVTNTFTNSNITNLATSAENLKFSTLFVISDLLFGVTNDEIWNFSEITSMWSKSTNLPDQLKSQRLRWAVGDSSENVYCFPENLDRSNNAFYSYRALYKITVPIIYN